VCCFPSRVLPSFLRLLRAASTSRVLMPDGEVRTHRTSFVRVTDWTCERGGGWSSARVARWCLFNSHNAILSHLHAHRTHDRVAPLTAPAFAARVQ